MIASRVENSSLFGVSKHPNATSSSLLSVTSITPQPRRAYPGSIPRIRLTCVMVHLLYIVVVVKEV